MGRKKNLIKGDVVESVDTYDLKSYEHKNVRAGSMPVIPTINARVDKSRQSR